MAEVSVTIDGKTYRMACDEGQEDHIVSLAKRLDAAIQSLKQGFGEIGDHRLAIMAGILMADALSEEEAKTRRLKSEITDLKNSRDATYDRFQQTEDSLCETVSIITSRLEEIIGKLNGNSQIMDG